MDQIDLLKKEKLVSALKFTMDTATDASLAHAMYTDGEFLVEVSLQHNEPRAVISISMPGETNKKKTDHALSDQATQYIKEQFRVMTLQSRLRNMTGIKQ